MAYEIDFLAVGDATKSGDAIALRYGTLSGPHKNQRVVVIDGGFTADGEALVQHVKRYYETDVVDLVISTHTDGDHVNGLFPVLERLRVAQLWMHMPWKHSSDFAKAHALGNIQEATVREALKRSLEDAVNLEALARKKGIPITEPFTHTSFDGNAVYVLGPSETYYTELVADFRGSSIPTPAPSILEELVKAARGAAERIAETLDLETLTDAGQTSAENNSSVITLLRIDGDALLFTADAGIPALANALDVLEGANFDFGTLKFVQAPHHGSQHNIGPTILNRLLGDKNLSGATTRTAFVSAAAEGAPHHPAKRVMNAFRRRGAPVHATQGKQKLHHRQGVDRGWSDSTALPLYSEVDD